MPITTDYHLHTPRCKHAKGPLEAYVERACQLGLRQVGLKFTEISEKLRQRGCGSVATFRQRRRVMVEL